MMPSCTWVMASAEPSRKILQLFAVFARRRGEASSTAHPLSRPVGAQLAGGHRLQTAAIGQRHHVLCSHAHGLGDRRLIDVFAHDQHRHFRSALSLDLHDRAQVDAGLVGERHQHLRVELRQGVPQIAGVGQPGAMDRMAGLAQGTVDRFDVVLRSFVMTIIGTAPCSTRQNPRKKGAKCNIRFSEILGTASSL